MNPLDPSQVISSDKRHPIVGCKEKWGALPQDEVDLEAASWSYHVKEVMRRLYVNLHTPPPPR